MAAKTRQNHNWNHKRIVWIWFRLNFIYFKLYYWLLVPIFHPCSADFSHGRGFDSMSSSSQCMHRLRVFNPAPHVMATAGRPAGHVGRHVMWSIHNLLYSHLLVVMPLCCDCERVHACMGSKTVPTVHSTSHNHGRTARDLSCIVPWTVSYMAFRTHYTQYSTDIHDHYAGYITVRIQRIRGW